MPDPACFTPNKTSTEMSPFAAITPDKISRKDTVLTFGKHQGRTYGEACTNFKSYCNFVLQEPREDMSFEMHQFREFLEGLDNIQQTGDDLGNSIFPSGKYKGETFEDVSRSDPKYFGSYLMDDDPAAEEWVLEYRGFLRSQLCFFNNNNKKNDKFESNSSMFTNHFDEMDSTYNESSSCKDDEQSAFRDDSESNKRSLSGLSQNETAKDDEFYVCIDGRCPSRKDAVTNQRLQNNHLCWITPNEGTRKCYNIRTLQKISKAKNKGVLLQPPLFRRNLSAQIQNQIAATFGHRSISLENDVGGSRDRDIDFQNQFSSYMKRLMGSRDLYVCPVCYGFKYSGMAGIAINDYESICKEISSRSYKLDPMSILSCYAGCGTTAKGLRLASTFCFRTLVDLKTHLEYDHKVNVSDVVGNDLFKAYQIRAADGLLQRWLKIAFPRTINPKSMQHYWAEGYDQYFIELSHLVDHSLVATDSSFFNSFSDQVESLWDMISGAYARSDDDEFDNFIVEEISETASVDNGLENNSVFREKDDAEENFVNFLRNYREKFKENSSVSSYEKSRRSSSNSSFNTEDDCQIETSSNDGSCGSETEESEDEWLAQKRIIPQKKKKIFSQLACDQPRKKKSLQKVGLSSESDQDFDELFSYNKGEKSRSSHFAPDDDKGTLIKEINEKEATMKKNDDIIDLTLSSDEEDGWFPKNHDRTRKKKICINSGHSSISSVEEMASSGMVGITFSQRSNRIEPALSSDYELVAQNHSPMSKLNFFRMGSMSSFNNGGSVAVKASGSKLGKNAGDSEGEGSEEMRNEYEWLERKATERHTKMVPISSNSKKRRLRAVTQTQEESDPDENQIFDEISYCKGYCKQLTETGISKQIFPKKTRRFINDESEDSDECISKRGE